MVTQPASLPQHFSFRKALTYVASAALVASTLVLGTSAPAEAAACGSGSASYAGGVGSSSDPWQIETAEQLIRISAQSADWDEYFVLTEDIDLLGCEWTPIAPGFGDSFSGVFDGDGHLITGLSINLPSSGLVGLFGRINGSSALIKNLGLENVAIRGGNYVGSIGGLLVSGRIENSYATGSVAGTQDTGGLVGQSQGVVENSYSRSDVTIVDWPGRTDIKREAIGGFTGAVGSGSITNSYSVGLITDSSSGAEETVGGFSGERVGTVTNAFWDTESSGKATSVSGTGKSSSEMKTLTTFNDTSAAGLTTAWPIVDGWQAFNFSSPTNYWGICPLANDGYPFLLWQYTSDPCVADSSGSSGSTDASAGVPGIFLYVAGPVGHSVSHSPVYYGTDRVAAASEYKVQVLSSSSAGSGAITLASGTLSPNGSIPATMVRLPHLEPGTYAVRMTGKHTTGKTLQLTAQITVGPAGTFTSIGPNIPVIR
jgi:hypothetical protein